MLMPVPFVNSLMWRSCCLSFTMSQLCLTCMLAWGRRSGASLRQKVPLFPLPWALISVVACWRFEPISRKRIPMKPPCAKPFAPFFAAHQWGSNSTKTKMYIWKLVVSYNRLLMKSFSENRPYWAICNVVIGPTNWERWVAATTSLNSLLMNPTTFGSCFTRGLAAPAM